MIPLKSCLFLAAGALLQANVSYSFESTKVAPKGVRSLTFKNLTTSMHEKTDANGNLQPLSEPMEKALTFRRAISSEANPYKRAQLKAFVLREKDSFALDDSIGQFTADFAATVDVWAPVFAYGVTDNITLAIAAPFYHMTTNADMGFTPNQNLSKKILTKLTRDMRQVGNAASVHRRINNAVPEVRRNLKLNGFSDLGPWEGTGLGDMTVAMKHRFYSDDMIAIAYQAGFVLPTGATDDPDILTDLPMGDGQLDAFFQVAIDESIGFGIMLNQFAKYTYQAKGSKTIRLATEIESVRVEKEKVDFKLGDKFDAGVSATFESEGGLLAGIGASYFRKFGDRIEGVASQVEDWITRESVQESFYAQYRIGYSTISAFKRKEFPIPMSVNLDYKKQLASKHRPIADLVALDLNLFF